eukprot:968894-Prymnesium_polylepis.1
MGVISAWRQRASAASAPPIARAKAPTHRPTAVAMGVTSAWRQRASAASAPPIARAKAPTHRPTAAEHRPS